MSVRIYVGAILGGPEIQESAVFSALRKVRACKDRLGESTDDPSKPGLDYVFHIAGSLFKPDYEGVRSGKFSRNKKLLMIQAAVPEKMVSSDHIIPFLCELMRQGVIEAMPVFEKAGIPFDADKFTEFIDDIEHELGWRK